MKTLKYIFVLLFIAYTSLLFAQKSDQHITIKRGDYKEFVFKHNGNVSSSDISFVVKLTKSFSSPRLIQKDNSDTTQISTIYSSPFTYIKVKLLQMDTRDFTASKYFYDIVADSTTIFDGEFRVNFDVQTPFDGTTPPTSGVRFYVAGTFIDTTVSDGSVFVWDSTAQTLSAISKDSLWEFLNVSDTVGSYLTAKLDAAALSDSLQRYKQYLITIINPQIGAEFEFDFLDEGIYIDSIYMVTKDSALVFNIQKANSINGTFTSLFAGNVTADENTVGEIYEPATIPFIDENYFLKLLIVNTYGFTNEKLFIKIFYRD